jgi:hypothetical protein
MADSAYEILRQDKSQTGNYYIVKYLFIIGLINFEKKRGKRFF